MELPEMFVQPVAVVDGKFLTMSDLWAIAKDFHKEESS